VTHCSQGEWLSQPNLSGCWHQHTPIAFFPLSFLQKKSINKFNRCSLLWLQFVFVPDEMGTPQLHPLFTSWPYISSAASCWHWPFGIGTTWIQTSRLQLLEAGQRTSLNVIFMLECFPSGCKLNDRDYYFSGLQISFTNSFVTEIAGIRHITAYTYTPNIL
jgi:hypothetical protein